MTKLGFASGLNTVNAFRPEGAAEELVFMVEQLKLQNAAEYDILCTAKQPMCKVTEGL